MTDFPVSSPIDVLRELLGRASEAPATLTVSSVAEILWARHRVALDARTPNLSQEIDVEALCRLDVQLRALEKPIRRLVDEETAAGWRSAIQATDSDWWWRLAGRNASVWPRATAAATWVTVAIALSFVVENVRRLLPNATDVTSTVIQGFVGLLVAGSFLQFARERLSKSDRELKQAAMLAALVVALAVGAHLARPTLAEHYSSRGVTLHREEHFADAIDVLERAIRLDPTDEITYANVAGAYEAIRDFDRAEEAYRNAIRYAQADAFPYVRLARLVMFRRKDWNQGLELLRRAEEALPGTRNVTTTQRSDVRYAIHKLRGWAYLELGARLEAQDELTEAIRVNALKPSAHCLMARVWRDTNRQKAIEAAEDCVRYSFGAKDVEPAWLAEAREIARTR